MAPETSSVIGYGEVHVQCEKKHCHYCSDKETEKDNQLQKSWSMWTSPGQKLKRRCTLRWVNLLRKHHSERSDFSNLTNENPRPSTFLKQDSNNNLQSRYLSYSRHSCCSGSLELHLHVTGVKDYICIHVKNIHIQEPACYGMTFKLRTDPRGTITTFCANTKPKYPSRRCEKQQKT